MKNVVAYLGREGEDAARRKITAWAASHGRRIAREFVEPDTALDVADRSALKDALVAVGAHAARELVASSWSAFGDSVSAALVDALTRLAGGVVVVLEGKAPANHERLVASFAAYGSLAPSVRVRAVWSMRRKRGESNGAIPWGYRLGPDQRTLVPDKREQRVLSIVAHMRAEGFTLRAIAEFLKSHGYRTRRGTPIGMAQVYRFVTGSNAAARPESAPRIRAARRST